MAEVVYGRRKTDMATEDKFVTYKWLIGTALTSLAISVSLMGILWSAISKNIDGKVSLEVYAAQYKNVCGDIEQIKSTVEENALKMDDIGKNQLLVLRHLRIEPVHPSSRWKK